MGDWSALAGAGGSVLGSIAGGLIGLYGDTKAYERQKFFASNAHQLEVEDLKKAGLNPVLSAGGGGASPPSVSNTLGSSAAAGAAAGATASRVGAEVDLLRAQAQSARAATAKSLADADATKREADAMWGKPGKIGVTILNRDGTVASTEPATRDPGLREREVMANVEYLKQKASELGFTNVRAAAEAGIYRDYPSAAILDKLLNYVDQVGSIKGKFSPKTLPQKGGKK